MKFRTESGSLYKVDYETMTWERLVIGNPKKTSRKNTGKLVARPSIILGLPAFLQDEDVKPNCIAHFVRTSPVVQIYDEAEAPAKE